MAAKLIDLTSYRRSRPGRRKLKIAKGLGILSLCDYRRLKQCGVSGDRLKGLGYPDDHLVGPDEVAEVTGETMYEQIFGFPMPITGISIMTPDKEDDEN